MIRPGALAKICPADVADATDILDLQRLCYRSEAEVYGDENLPPLWQTVEQLADDINTMVVLKATENGRIIGSVRARETGGTCYVGRLIVHPDRQNQGLGRRLMAAIEERFAEAERFELFTGDRSAKSLSLYAKLGYCEFKRQVPNEKVTLVYLHKPRRATS
jgi:ribosomal protein S18 acetylase RimI-like enzyme